MAETETARRYRFGVFELDTATGELRRKGLRVRLHAQPFQVLCLLLERPGAMLTREEISRALWPEGTFVDYEHGVNSAVNRLRDALGDKAKSPQFVETLARRGYRFVAPVERLDSVGTWDASVQQAVPRGHLVGAVELRSMPTVPPHQAKNAWREPRLNALDEARVEDGAPRFTVLATSEDLPETSHAVVRGLYLALQLMYVAFYVGALANLAEISELLSALPHAGAIDLGVRVTAVVLIPVRTFLMCAVLFRPPGTRSKLLLVWRYLMAFDVVWALAPFLLLHHLSEGLVLAAMTLLVYSPFAQRSLILMGAGDGDRAG